jgi:hypothetical protein
MIPCKVVTLQGNNKEIAHGHEPSDDPKRPE